MVSKILKLFTVLLLFLGHTASAVEYDLVSQVSRNWLTDNSDADYNKDGIVNLVDFAIAANYSLLYGLNVYGLNSYSDQFLGTNVMANEIPTVGGDENTWGTKLNNYMQKGQGWVDVRAFGAVLDGTTNDAVALQAAIDSLTSGGVVLVPGVCAIGSSSWVGITITSKSGITIRGIGPSGGFKVLVAPSQTVESLVTVLKIDTCTNIKIENINFNGNSFDAQLIGLDDSDDCVIENNYLHDTGSSLANGVMSVGGNRNKFLSNTIINTGRGLWIGNNNVGKIETEAIISHNVVNNTQATCIGGILDGGTIIGNQCLNSAGSGIALGSANTETYRNTTITGNVCRGNAFTGIQSDVIGTAYIQGVTISNNICMENGSDGILLVNIIDSTISGNLCIDNNFDGSGSGYGIQIGKFAKRLQITGNYCYETRSGGDRTQLDGIQVVSGTIADGVNNINIVGNFCYNHPSDGIVVANSGIGTISKISLRSNYTFSNGEQGIAISHQSPGEITDVTVIGNVSYDNATDIRVDPTDTLVLGNDVAGVGNILVGGVNAGLSLTTAAAKLHVDQSLSTGAIPVLALDQADVDDSFINFIGTSAADGSKSISSDTTENSAKFGAIRIEINGVTKWIRIYDDES